jgi:hypothetical protein
LETPSGLYYIVRRRGRGWGVEIPGGTDALSERELARMLKSIRGQQRQQNRKHTKGGITNARHL